MRAASTRMADAAAATAKFDCAVFDMDGTLVDSNYHHVIAWHRAFRAHRVDVPLWQIHRRMGMGGDRLVPDVAGRDTEQSVGEKLRQAWKKNFSELVGEVAVLPGAVDLLHEIKRRGLTLVLASSGEPEHVEHFIDLLGARDVADGWTTSTDVESTKPEPDLLEVALSKAGDRDSVVPLTFGDSTWDCIAAARLGLPAVTLLTGGFGADELRAAGAIGVYESLDDVRADLDELFAP